MKGIRRKLFGTKRRVIVSSIIGVFLLAGTAFAAWTVITSTGTSNAKVGNLTMPTIANGDVTTAGDIFPSATNTGTGGLRMSISNPNAGTLYLKSLTVTALNVADVAGNNAQCDFNGRTSAANAAPQYFGWAGNGANWFTVSGANLVAGQVTKTFSGLSIAVPAGVNNPVVVPAAIYAVDATPTECQGNKMQGLAITSATFSTTP